MFDMRFVCNLESRLYVTETFYGIDFVEKKRFNTFF